MEQNPANGSPENQWRKTQKKQRNSNRCPIAHFRKLLLDKQQCQTIIGIDNTRRRRRESSAAVANRNGNQQCSHK